MFPMDIVPQPNNYFQIVDSNKVCILAENNTVNTEKLENLLIF